MFFTRSWIQTILQKSKAELQRRELASGRGEMLRKLEAFLEDSTEGASYKDVSEDLGMTQVALRKTVSRLRERYRDVVREQIAATLKDPTEAAVEAEIRSLWAVLNKK
jgi:RNA polymerase sigma-70 factor (ECF subfamily)